VSQAAIEPETPEAMSKRLNAQLVRWAAGKATLKEIKGYTDDEVYAIAHTAYFFMMQGKNQEARTLFEGLVALDSHNDYYYRALGVIFHKMGEAERALKQFGYAIQVNPRSAPAYVNRAELYIASDRYPEAERDLRKALEVLTVREVALGTKVRALIQLVSRPALPPAARRG
jgi:tetratricopeptide (TPR) repeat protein